MYIVLVDDVQVTYNDYQYIVHILGDETEARSDEEALRNVLYRRYNDKWSRKQIAYVAENLIERNAYEAYDLDLLEDVGSNTPMPKSELEDPESLPESIATIKQAFQWEYDLRQPQNTTDLGIRLRDYEIPTNRQETGLQHPEFHEQSLEKEPDY